MDILAFVIALLIQIFLLLYAFARRAVIGGILAGLVGILITANALLDGSVSYVSGGQTIVIALNGILIPYVIFNIFCFVVAIGTNASYQG